MKKLLKNKNFHLILFLLLEFVFGWLIFRNGNKEPDKIEVVSEFKKIKIHTLVMLCWSGEVRKIIREGKTGTSLTTTPPPNLRGTYIN